MDVTGCVARHWARSLGSCSSRQSSRLIVRRCRPQSTPATPHRYSSVARGWDALSGRLHPVDSRGKCWSAVLQVDVGASWSVLEQSNDQPTGKQTQQVAALWHANTQRIVELHFRGDLICVEGAGMEGEESVSHEYLHAQVNSRG